MRNYLYGKKIKKCKMNKGCSQKFENKESPTESHYSKPLNRRLNIIVQLPTKNSRSVKNKLESQ